MYQNELSSNDLPANDLPANELSSNDLPANELSSNDLPANDLPANELSSNDLPANDLPANELSSNDLPANDLPANDLPANELKIQGNIFFKNKEYNKANEQYIKALNKTNSDKELSILYSNISATYCKLEKYNKALENATIATKKNSEWYKSWYRLSFVLYKLNKLDQAKTSINKTLELCENNVPSDIEFIQDLKKDIYKNIKNDDTEDETETENENENENDDENENTDDVQDLNDIMSMMNNMLKNKDIKNKLGNEEFQKKIMNNKNNPFEMLKDPEMQNIMNKMIKNMSKTKNN